MKHFLFVLLIGLLPGMALAQKDTLHADDSNALSKQDTALAEDGEAGGISGAEEDTASDSPGIAWLQVVLGFAAGALIAGLAVRLASKKPTGAAPATVGTGDNVAAVAGNDAAKLKEEYQKLSRKVDALQQEKKSMQQQLDDQRRFDDSYYEEAFRRLVVPMNEAMEKGSRKEVMENLVKTMSHFGSLTRYKIAKKQPYDETNIQYLVQQKAGNDGAITEINGATPIDKIPKNIKVILDLLKEQDSQGLDQSIIAGYRIKNI